VRLYDASLSGADQQLPGSACGVAGDGARACAAGGEQPSTVTVGEFVDVAQANALGFGECRLRIQRLIDFLQARQGAEPVGLNDAAGGVASGF